MNQKLTKEEFNNTIGEVLYCPVCSSDVKIIKINNILYSECLHWQGER